MRIEMPIDEFFEKFELNKAIRLALFRFPGWSTHDEVDFSGSTFEVNGVQMKIERGER